VTGLELDLVADLALGSQPVPSNHRWLRKGLQPKTSGRATIDAGQNPEAALVQLLGAPRAHQFLVFCE
jgi:hypothetical protein